MIFRRYFRSSANPADQCTSLNGVIPLIDVFDHINPDSDAVCTAVVTAGWLNRFNRPACAWRFGEANPETRYIFETAGLILPPVLDFSLKDEQVWLVDFTEPVQLISFDSEMIISGDGRKKSSCIFSRRPFPSH